MLETIIVLLLLILIVGVRIMAVVDDILTAQTNLTAALAALAAQKAASITPAQAAQILQNEQLNLSTAQGLITP